MDFKGKVAIITGIRICDAQTCNFCNSGAGGALGRSYALLLASRGAKVVVNDL